jgi:hypothetical protein
MLRLLRRFKGLIAPILVAGLLFANFSVLTAHAHNWGGWHWDKSGPAIYIYQYNTASQYGLAEAARQNAWNTISILYNYNTNTHTDVSVFDGNFGNTGWGGLAEIWDSWDWGCWCWDHITHGHARYNSYYGGDARWIQGVFCQEVFHTYGFTHSNDGGCMGLGYWYGTEVPGAIFLNGHNNSDFYNRYRNH